MLEGEVDFHLTEARIACGPGDVWLCGMWEPHAWEIPRGGAANVSLIFLPELLQELPEYSVYAQLFASPPERRARAGDASVRALLLQIGQDLRRQIAARPQLWEAAVRLDLLRILTELSRLQGQGEASDGPAPAGQANALARVTPAIELVHERPRARISAPEAAAACSLSTSRFQHLFREAVGVSFGRFSLRVRLALVAHLLLHSDDTVERIAEGTGFVDVSHLSRAFAAHYGASPTGYRRSRR